jgi:hypothetical protein
MLGTAKQRSPLEKPKTKADNAKPPLSNARHRKAEKSPRKTKNKGRQREAAATRSRRVNWVWRPRNPRRLAPDYERVSETLKELHDNASSTPMLREVVPRFLWGLSGNHTAIVSEQGTDGCIKRRQRLGVLKCPRITHWYGARVASLNVAQ